MATSVKLHRHDDSDERGSNRWRLLLSPLESTLAGSDIEVALRDISSTGFLIESAAPLAIGCTLTVDLPGAGTSSANIVWSSGQLFGGQFERELSGEELRAIVAASSVVWPRFREDASFERASPVSTGESKLVAERPRPQEPSRFSVGTRTLIIAAASSLLWAAIAVSAWALFS